MFNTKLYKIVIWYYKIFKVQLFDLQIVKFLYLKCLLTYYFLSFVYSFVFSEFNAVIFKL